MESPADRLQHLVSLPPRMAERFEVLEHRLPPGWRAGHDPEGTPLGSAGGTVHLLAEAWRADGGGETFETWLGQARRLVLHAGGQSRRLPAYAPTGKVLMPVPVFRWARGQRLEQNLLDLQVRDYQRVLRHAPGDVAVMIASGDVLLRFDPDLPPFPEVDVLGLGMWTTPEVARDFGVFFVERQAPERLAFFLQKPSPERIRALAVDHLFLVDTGMWLLSARAVRWLFQRCGWNSERQQFAGGRPKAFELYSEFGLALGARPGLADPEIAKLTSAVVPLPKPEFHHFGTSRQMIQAVSALQNRELDQSRLGSVGAVWHPDQYVQNSRIQVAVHREQNHTLWIENSVIPASWRLATEHVLTGVPENTWNLELEPGVCLDFVPLRDGTLALRFYGIDDRFSGEIGDAGTRFLDRPAADWLARRGLESSEVGGERAGQVDLQQARWFPALPREAWTDGFIHWLFREDPGDPVQQHGHREQWRRARRCSAAELLIEVDPNAIYAQRQRLRGEALATLMENRSWSVFHRLDLGQTARLFAATHRPLPESLGAGGILDRVHERMFRAAVLRERGAPDWGREERAAFETLRDAVVRQVEEAPVSPEIRLIEDQLVWARSPVRFDLAGGWTDTPPYCLEHGGQVVNVAVDLNGQPPMQVFVRATTAPQIVFRSIDLGREERVTTFDELDRFGEPGNAFALAKAACALAGLLPRFHAGRNAASLRTHLERIGGGLEISLVSAVPKGSGLGTSSILAATALAALSEALGLGWDRQALFQRTLAVEQLMTTGGGWQDQAGGLFPGVKLIQTTPGLAQVPQVRWLPDRLLGGDFANRRILLYYTGITRMAKGILSEIVRGIFLNAPDPLATLEEIAESAAATALALERCDYEGFGEAVATTWRLKQRLDPGSNPAPIQAMLDALREDLIAAELPGAGGGGYLLLLARNEEAAARIRRRLTEYPPNPRARFVEFGVSPIGLHVTRS